MAYTPNSWLSTTPITSALLNHLETQYDLGYADFLLHNHDTRYYTIALMKSGFWYANNDGSGSGCDADLLYTTGGNKHAADLAGVGVPSGLIIMWSGAIVDIPAGWYLCDGNNGTPQLKDRFVPGAGDTYDPLDTGGSNTKTLTGTVTIEGHALTLTEMPRHRHPYLDLYAPVSTYYYQSGGAGTQRTETRTTYPTGGSGDIAAPHGHPGSTFDGIEYDNKPSFYALAFIMKS